MTTHHAAGAASLFDKIRPHWKAVVGFLVALVGGLVTAFPNSAGVRVLAAVVTAIATGAGVHAADDGTVAPAAVATTEVEGS